MKNFKIAASFGLLFISLNSNATNMGSWVGSSVIKNENKQNNSNSTHKTLNSFFGNGSLDEDGPVSQPTNQRTSEAIKPNTEFGERPESQLIANQRQQLKAISENQEDLTLTSPPNEYADSNPVSSEPRNTQVLDNKKQANALPAVSDNEILLEQKKMEAFILKAQQFVGSNMLDSLSTEQSLAISLLNAALMQVGVEELSGMSSSSNQSAYNKAVGCVNSFSNAGLNSASTTLVSKYMSIVNIAPVVKVGPQIGGNFKAKCY